MIINIFFFTVLSQKQSCSLTTEHHHHTLLPNYFHPLNKFWTLTLLPHYPHHPHLHHVQTTTIIILTNLTRQVINLTNLTTWQNLTRCQLFYTLIQKIKNENLWILLAFLLSLCKMYTINISSSSFSFFSLSSLPGRERSCSLFINYPINYRHVMYNKFKQKKFYVIYLFYLLFHYLITN